MEKYRQYKTNNGNTIIHSGHETSNTSERGVALMIDLNTTK